MGSIIVPPIKKMISKSTHFAYFKIVFDRNASFEGLRDKKKCSHNGFIIESNVRKTKKPNLDL